MKLIDSFNEKFNKKQRIYIILLIIFLLIFAVSSVFAFKAFYRPKNNDADKYKREVKTDNTEELPDNPIDFSKLQSDNNEVVGWISVPSTEEKIIDYPILQSGFETDEDFYINHDIQKQYKSAGSIYIQKDNASDFTDFNTVIYGHNMLNKSMFGTLKRYRNAEYFKNNRTITIYTPGHVLEYEIVSAFVFDDRLIISAYNYFMQDDKKQEFIDICRNPNTLAKNVVENFDVTVDDRLITLSTCTSVDTERYLVVGKLVKDTKTK